MTIDTPVDHTNVATLADVRAIRPQDVPTHPLLHVLTNVLGGRDSLVQVDCRELRLVDSDQILLCTDGMTDLVSDDAIRQVLQGVDTAANACRALVDRALDAGGRDNMAVGRCHIPIHG